MASEVVSVSNSHPFRSINLAKEELLKGLREAEQQAKTIKEILANMEAAEKRSGQNLEMLPPVRKDEYRGMRAADALEIYLRSRRGYKIPLTRAVADLVDGGTNPGQPRGKKTDPIALVLHTLKIAVPNRRNVFRYTPEGTAEKTGAFIIPKGVRDEEIIIWLSEEADEPQKRKRPR